MKLTSVELRIPEQMKQYIQVNSTEQELLRNAFCVPYREYEDKKSWYDFFVNIERESQVIYG